MSKLAELRGWFNLDAAAEALAKALGEPVSVGDLLMLVIEQRLRLSVYFIEPVNAVECLWIKPSARDRLNPLAPEFVCVSGGRALVADSAFGIQGPPYHETPLEGLYDLQLEGAAHELLRFNILMSQDQEPRFGSSHVPLILETSKNDQHDYGDRDDVCWVLAKGVDEDGIVYPDPMPSSAKLVIRREVMARLLADMSFPEAKGERAQKTDALIIGALLQYIRGEFKGAKAHPSFTSQAQLIGDFGAHFEGVRGFSRQTIEKRFGEANKAVDEAGKELAKRPK
jgi:hypothetical protein